MGSANSRAGPAGVRFTPFHGGEENAEPVGCGPYRLDDDLSDILLDRVILE